MTPGPPTLDELVRLIPHRLLHESGSVLYSGRASFRRSAPVYLLGLNPGGDPDSLHHATIERDTAWVLSEAPENWSRYRDESWGAAPGHSPLQRRVRHLLDGLGLDPGHVPSSNLIFLRSRVEADIARSMDALVEQCWPFHQAIIDRLDVKTIVCFGASVAGHVRSRLSASHQWGQFKESNRRGWTSRGFESSHGPDVVQVTHPGRADWTAPSSDITPLVQASLRRHRS